MLYESRDISPPMKSHTAKLVTWMKINFNNKIKIFLLGSFTVTKLIFYLIK